MPNISIWHFETTFNVCVCVFISSSSVGRLAMSFPKETLDEFKKIRWTETSLFKMIIKAENRKPRNWKKLERNDFVGKVNMCRSFVHRATSTAGKAFTKLNLMGRSNDFLTVYLLLENTSVQFVVDDAATSPSLCCVRQHVFYFRLHSVAYGQLVFWTR